MPGFSPPSAQVSHSQPSTFQIHHDLGKPDCNTPCSAQPTPSKQLQSQATNASTHRSLPQLTPQTRASSKHLKQPDSSGHSSSSCSSSAHSCSGSSPSSASPISFNFPFLPCHHPFLWSSFLAILCCQPYAWPSEVPLLWPLGCDSSTLKVQLAHT